MEGIAVISLQIRIYNFYKLFALFGNFIVRPRIMQNFNVFVLLKMTLRHFAVRETSPKRVPDLTLPASDNSLGLINYSTVQS